MLAPYSRVVPAAAGRRGVHRRREELAAGASTQTRSRYRRPLTNLNIFNTNTNEKTKKKTTGIREKSGRLPRLTHYVHVVLVNRFSVVVRFPFLSALVKLERKENDVSDTSALFVIFLCWQDSPRNRKGRTRRFSPRPKSHQRAATAPRRSAPRRLVT